MNHLCRVAILLSFLFNSVHGSAAEEELSVDKYDFSRKSELLEQLQEAEQTVDGQYQQALQDGDVIAAQNLRRSKLHINAAVRKVFYAQKDNWEKTRDSLKEDLRAAEIPDFLDLGIWNAL